MARDSARSENRCTVKTHIALIGFMAAGKSTIGRRLARELGLPFIDTDASIAERYGPIDEIFAQSGEAGFRLKEFEIVRSALAGTPAVLALGGGAVTHDPTRMLLVEHATRVFIEVPLRTIVSRLRRSQTLRPLIGERLDLERVRSIYESRLPLYREAEITIAGTRRSQSELAREIATRLRARAMAPAS